jgi:uncharacterized RDD family membrane protein YckC
MTVLKRALAALAVCLGIVCVVLPGALLLARMGGHQTPTRMRPIALRRGSPLTIITDPPPVIPDVPRARALLNAPRAPADSDTQEFQDYRRYRPIFRLWQDFALGPDDEIGQAVVVAANATIAGHVNSDVVVWLGDVKLTSTSVISGSLVVVAGNVTVEEGANVRRDLVVFGGEIHAPPTFTAGGDHFVIGTPSMGQDVRAIVPWVTRGLLWGRIFVPSVGWIWALFAIVFAVSLVLNHVFDRAVGTTASVVVTRPLSVFLTGLVVLLLAGPLIVILGASIVGLLVIPFLLCAAFIAWTVGKIAFARGLGMRVMPPRDPDSRLLSARSFVIGFVLITLAYAVPILGIVMWALVSVFGLGAAGMTVVATIRREYPSKPKAPKPAKAAPSAPPDIPAGGGSLSDMPLRPAPMATSFVGEPAFAGHPITAAVADVPPFDPTRGASGLAAFPRAAFLDRAAAFALDCLLIAIIDRMLDLTRADGAYFLLLFGYHVAFWALKGTTLGGIVCGLRVVRTNGGTLRAVDAIVRGLASILSLALLGLGCFWMLQDPQRQTWHDKIAGTYVVKVPRDLALE